MILAVQANGSPTRRGGTRGRKTAVREEQVKVRLPPSRVRQRAWSLACGCGERAAVCTCNIDLQHPLVDLAITALGRFPFCWVTTLMATPDSIPPLALRRN